MFRNIILISLMVLLPGMSAWGATITDAQGRQVDVPDKVERVICSGSGCLRLLTYLQAQNLIVGVDSIEKRHTPFDARPYAMANPQFRDYPIFGEFRGFDRPELILGLEKQPQVIFKTYGSMGHDPDELQLKTGIPVVVLNYGDLVDKRAQLYHSLRLMGQVVDHDQRAEQVIAFFNSCITDLQQRSAGSAEKKSCFVGGIASKGPHGFQSTEPSYPPFVFTNAGNLAAGRKNVRHCSIAKEQIVAWDPEILLLDLSTLQMGESAGGLHELKTDPSYRSLSAVREGRIYGVLPYNWYSQNFGSILADAYFTGKLLYPERFSDIDPAAKADEIYSFLVGKPMFNAMNSSFGGLVFKQIPMEP